MPKELTTDDLQSLHNQQEELRKLVVENDVFDISTVKRIGGCDISFYKDDAETAVAALVVLEYPSLKVVYEDVREVPLTVPYKAGYLGWRESPPLLLLIQHLKETSPETSFDILMADGNGVLHPAQFGLACHVGVGADVPCIGVSKNLHCCHGMTKESVKSAFTECRKSTGEGFTYSILQPDDCSHPLGIAFRGGGTSTTPLYASVGHNICLNTIINILPSLCKYKVPEPIRQADLISREFIRQRENEVTKRGEIEKHGRVEERVDE